MSPDDYSDRKHATPSLRSSDFYRIITVFVENAPHTAAAEATQANFYIIEVKMMTWPMPEGQRCLLKFKSLTSPRIKCRYLATYDT